MRGALTGVARGRYARLRVGVGAPKASTGDALLRHVLGNFTKAELDVVPLIVDAVAKLVELWVMEDNTQRVVQAVNTKPR